MSPCRWVRGSLDRSRVLLVDPGRVRAWLGGYSDAGPRAELVRAGRVEVRQYGDQGCVRRLRVPESGGSEGQTLQTVPLPVRIRMAGGRLSVTSSRLLMFNRIAKVGG